MKRPSAKQWAIAMTVTSALLAACTVFFIATTAGLFFFHYTATADLCGAYASDANHYTELVSQYTQHFERHGSWPAPGTYSEDGFKYLSTATLPTGEREDAYHSDYDRGMEVHFELRDDGTIRVWPFPG